MGRLVTPDTANNGFLETSVRVRYADTDKMGVVYYGRYPVYFEVGRSEYMREKGFSYKEFEDTGYILVVVGLEATYHGSAMYDDVLFVRTRITELKSRGLTFLYEIYRNGTMIVEGRTKHICVNESKKSVQIPPRLLAVLKDVKSE
jgi:acyl-CoA thioester hydrolase